MISPPQSDETYPAMQRSSHSVSERTSGTTLFRCSISVITVTFNAESHLADLVDSLRTQSDRDFEWIVVDGASTDGTLRIIEGAGDVVTRHVSETDFGIYHAMNKGLELATGDYYLVVGADDRLHPDAIANYRRTAQASGADVISAHVHAIEGSCRLLPQQGKSWLRGHLAFVSQHSVGALFRRDLHTRFGLYSRRFPIAADQHFVKRVCMAPDIRCLGADFIAGYYSLQGTSAVDVPGSLTEFFRVQLETERCTALQVCLFLLRLLRHYAKVARYCRGRRVSLA